MPYAAAEYALSARSRHSVTDIVSYSLQPHTARPRIRPQYMYITRCVFLPSSYSAARISHVYGIGRTMVSQKSGPLKLFAVFSVLVNPCN